MTRIFALALGAGFLVAGAAMADPIEGNWKTEAGSTARIAPCGSQFCIKLVSGSHSGKEIGKLKAEGGEYTGTITDPANEKTYDGRAWLPDNATLKMRGYSGIFFRTQTWTRE